VYRTPAVIAFNSRVVSRENAPHDWDDVLDPRWTDKVLIRDPMASGTMRAIWGLIIVRSIRETGDTTRAMRWLRRLDRQTKAYTLNPAILDARLARAEGLVTLWDLPDILIGRPKGIPFDYVYPRSGTVVIDDAIGLVRGSRHPEAARAFIDYVGGVEAQLLAAREVFRLPARHDLPAGQVPAWVAEVEREMVVAPMDWPLLAREGAAWMGYWDRHVRGTGRERADR
jgi:iron(III) transport system substrate-binding protein